jgi:hypothetical protein
MLSREKLLRALDANLLVCRQEEILPNWKVWENSGTQYLNGIFGGPGKLGTTKLS